jgi:hypothetical protein
MNARRHAFGRFERGILRNEDCEFVSSQAGKGIGRAHYILEPRSHQSQQLIAGRMTYEIVDIAKPIEIDRQDGDFPAILF